MQRICLVLWITLAAAAQSSRDAVQNPLRGNADAIEQGRKTFLSACAACHGQGGEGGRGPNLTEGKLVLRATDEQWFTAIQKGVAGTEMPKFPFPDQKIWRIVAFVRSLRAPAIETSVPGDSNAGRGIVEKVGCLQCHSIRGRGGLFAPDLSNIGVERSYAQLRESLLKPSDRLTPGYQTAEVVTRDGRRISGVARNYDNYSAQLVDRRGRPHLLTANQIETIKLETRSLMPDDYATKLTAREIDNVLAFLSRQSIRSDQ